VLGLAWLRHHPQIAACGASNSGKITFLKYEPGVPKTEPALSFKQCLEEFPKLSSLSTNCTDDFMLVSGISPNLAVYDVQTGKVLVKASNVHEHFINISRFCNTSPHVFATSSFDHTCKVWDLRRPVVHDRPVKTLVTGGQNVMCTFSPDDKHILCSGVDTRLSQFETPSWHQWPERFPLREPLHRERYRRSIYTASGQHFVTAATEESHMHLMSVSGKKLGVVDFRGVIKEQAPLRKAPRSPASGARGALVKGTVQLDDADPNGGSSRNNHEFVQSIRAHPELNNRFGVLLTLASGEQSYVAVVDVDRRALLSESL
jgi:WD40 repeat protein